MTIDRLLEMIQDDASITVQDLFRLAEDIKELAEADEKQAISAIKAGDL